ncbi:MAG TPA: sensor histidine kinase [Paenibacillus sp.]|nr:sensor histidine kinase [Paenibacillus sp.]
MNKRSGTAFLPLRSKVIVLFCLFTTIPFLAVGTTAYVKYSAGVERNTAELTYQVVDQIRLNLDRYVKEMERLTLMPFYDDDVMRILKAHSGPHLKETYLTTDESLKMNLFISSLAFDRSEIESILFFANDGSIFSNSDQSVSRFWASDAASWMAEVKAKDGALTLIPPHEAAYYNPSRKRVSSIARVIREPYTNETLGIVKVDLTKQGFEKMVSSVRLGQGSTLSITDSEGQLFYSSSSEEFGLIDTDDYLSSSASSAYTGLKVTALIPREDLRKDARELSRFTLIVSLVCLVLAYVVAVLSTDRLVRPIAHLQSKMRQVQRGLFKERALVTTNDEIGQLTEGFNTMVDEIDRLVKEVYETRLREREAELSALQSQIHPHFLYNTLETMNMLALQGQQRKLSSIITNLGKLLRYTVDKRENQVLLRDEVRCVEAYLHIQESRLDGRLRTDVQIDPSFEGCRVPKLILQPLVENVIEHALGSADLRMSLTARAENDDLLLVVKDDGVGMSAERLEWLKRQLAEDAHDRGEPGGFGTVKKGFALRNVHQRIRLLYGEPYGLETESSENQGAAFTVRLPIHWGD